MQHAGAPGRYGCRTVTARFSCSRCLHADNAHAFLINKWVEHADRVRAAANTGYNSIREPVLFLVHCGLCFLADHALEYSDQGGERMRPGGSAKAVMRCFMAGYPGPQGFVDRILERGRAGCHGMHLRPQKAHAPHIGRLPGHVLRAHVNHAIEAQARGRGRRRDAVLARACFRNQGCLAHAFCQQSLAKRVIDLVRAGVQKILAFEPEIEAKLLRKRRAMR